jgi:hypothetical protein
MTTPTLDLHEIQATVLRQRPAPYFGTHVLLWVDDAQAGRAFLRWPTPYFDSPPVGGSRPMPGCRLESPMQAWKQLHVPSDSLQSFPGAFREGMAARARQLGDEGVNDPKNWTSRNSGRGWALWGDRGAAVTRKDRP